MSLADYACADEPAHVFAYHADALTFLRSLPDEWVHAIITDPPYGLADHKPERVAQAITAWATGDRELVPTGKGFMGREWDAFVPPPAVWDECLRVLKPGGHLAVFAGSRTVDLMGLSIRLAGFEMRDGIAAWLYGSGFPKSLDVGKAIDKARNEDKAPRAALCAWLADQADARGFERREIDEHMGTSDMAGWWLSRLPHRCAVPTVEQWETLKRFMGLPADMDAEVWRLNGRKGTPGEAWSTAELLATDERMNEPSGIVGVGQGERSAVAREIKAANSDAAREWQGWGTALKPAHEPILLARKPLAGTVAANVLAHRTGALNIDATRVAHASDADLATSLSKNPGRDGETATSAVYGADRPQQSVNVGGRWPTNVVLAHHPECRDTGETRAVKTGTAVQPNGGGQAIFGGIAGSTNAAGARPDASYGENGREQVPVFECAPGCQVAALDEQSGTLTSGNRKAGEHGLMGYMGADAAPMPAVTGDSGGASRFFPTFRYQAKAPKAERPIVDGTGHPTVKPLGLMRWLVRLLVPGEVDYPDGSGTCGAVLDPFAGSGATLEAARLEGRRAVGVERDEHSVRLIAQRLGVPVHLHAAPPVEEPTPEPPPPTPTELLLAKAATAESVDALMELYGHAQAEGLWNDEVRAVFSARKAEVAA